MINLLRQFAQAIGDLWTSVVRTATPIIAGAVIGWLAARNVEVDTQTQTALLLGITAAFQIVWHVLARALEVIGAKAGLPWLVTFGGLLVGLPAPPAYGSDAVDSQQSRAPPVQ